MRNPLDILLYNSLMLKSEQSVYTHMFGLLTTIPLTIYYWPEWSGLVNGRHLPVEATGKDFGPEAENFFLFSDTNIDNTWHTPCIVEALQEEARLAWLTDFCWNMSGVLVYRLDEDNFDAFGLMYSNISDHTVPEFQLRFTRTETGWGWYRAQSGFINPLVYGEAVMRVSEEVLDTAINHYGNVVSLFLGGYHAHMQQNGAWEEILPKPARVKYDKHGNVKKFYRIARSGYFRFIPETET